MNLWLRRFAFVGLAATVIDIGSAVLLIQIGIPTVISDLVALTVAAVVARILHEKITLINDPHARWIRNIKVFAAVVTIAGITDLIILTSLGPGDGVGECFVAKLTAVLGAAVTRGISYRFVLFREVRKQQLQPNSENFIALKPRVTLIIPTYE